jgi:hypothetical protein
VGHQIHSSKAGGLMSLGLALFAREGVIVFMLPALVGSYRPIESAKNAKQSAIKIDARIYMDKDELTLN